MRNYIALIILFLPPPLLGQSLLPSSYERHTLLPRPYAFVGEGMGAGYSPFALIGGAGLRIDSEHLILDTTAWYDSGRKSDDNSCPNPKGHDRGLTGSAYFRVASGWSFGGGARWSQLSTTNYTRSAWRPTFGGNRDFFVRNCQAEDCHGQFTMRIGLDYVMPGTDQNGTQGPQISFYAPSPSLNRHFFFRENLGIYKYHDMVTDPRNLIMTQEQVSGHAFDSFFEMTLMYRF